MHLNIVMWGFFRIYSVAKETLLHGSEGMYHVQHFHVITARDKAGPLLIIMSTKCTNQQMVPSNVFF